MSYCLQPYGLSPTRLLCPWDSPGKNTGVGCHALLQGTFPTQGLDPSLLGLLHWQADSLPLAPPRKLHICSYVHNKRAVHCGYLWEGTLWMRGSKSRSPFTSYASLFFALKNKQTNKKYLFPIQRLNLRFLHCRQILYHLSHQVSPF